MLETDKKMRNICNAIQEILIDNDIDVPDDEIIKLLNYKNGVKFQSDVLTEGKWTFDGGEWSNVT